MELTHELENMAIHLKVKISYDPWGGYCATDDNYEPGYPMAFGKTIQAAIEDYLEQAYQFYIEEWEHSVMTYTWS